jgi:hypothetical protein
MLSVIDRFMEKCSLEARRIAVPACEDDLPCELFAERGRSVGAVQPERGAYARSRPRADGA